MPILFDDCALPAIASCPMRLDSWGYRTIDQISPYPLWIGHSGDGMDFARLLGLGIEAVVQVAAEEPPLTPPRGLLYHRFPLLDGPGNPPAHLAMAIGTVAALLRARIPTLVCCGMGMSRSPAIAASALAWLGGGSPDQALRALAACHPVDVSPGLWREARVTMPAPFTVGAGGPAREGDRWPPT